MLRFILLCVCFFSQACGRNDLSLAQQQKPIQQRPIPNLIDWQKASAFRALQTATLSRESLEKLITARVPILLPARTELLQVLKLTGEKDWYAASMNLEGVNVFLQGNRLSFEQPHLSLPAHPDLSDPSEETICRLQVGRGEYIASVSFNAFGMSYILEVACDAAATDPRCNQDEFILSLVRSLSMANQNQVRP